MVAADRLPDRASALTPFRGNSLARCLLIRISARDGPGNRQPERHFVKAQQKQHRVNVAGLDFDAVTMNESLERIDTMIASGRPHQIATANVDFAFQASRDPELRRILAESALVVCDGAPLVWAARGKGTPLPERVAGSDMTPRLMAGAAEKGYRVYLLGGRPDVAEKAVKRLKSQYPALQIVGAYSPDFAPLDRMDHEGICARIRQANPDILLVSFGCPKQEKWIARNLHRIGSPVCIGVGATIDFLAGEVKRAPSWIGALGLEWVFRMLQEPRRLAGRYARNIPFFIRAIVSDLLRARFGWGVNCRFLNPRQAAKA